MTEEKKYKRTGECKRCGDCGCEKLKCIHFIWKDGLATCLIYNERKDEICKECLEKTGLKINHKNCITFPSIPANVKNYKQCGFKFKEI